MRLGSGLFVFLGLMCLQRRALGQDLASEEVRILAHCDDPQVTGSVEEALNNFNKRLYSGHELALYQITQATKADNSSGTMVHVEFNSRQSDCSAEGDQKPWKECGYLPDGPEDPSPCIATVYVTTTEFMVQSVHCELEPRMVMTPALCLGCPIEIDVESEDLKDPLTISLTKYNAMSDSAHFFVINTIAFATRQVIAGFRYRLTFDMRKSNCSKADYEKPSHACHPNPEDVELAHCNSTVDVAPWRHEVPETHLDCGTGPIMSTFERRRPSGWTPLRTIENPTNAKRRPSGWTPLRNIDEPSTTGAPSDTAAGKESSEESLDKPKPTTADSPFHCPSKPWKEFVKGVPHAPTDMPQPVPEGFSDMDLLDIVG